MRFSKGKWAGVFAFVFVAGIFVLFENCQNPQQVHGSTVDPVPVNEISLLPADFVLVSTPSEPAFGTSVILKPSFYENPDFAYRFKDLTGTS